MANREVDLKTSGADLLVNPVAKSFYDGGDGFLDGKSASCDVEICSSRTPVSAYCRNRLRTRAPSPLARSGSMSPAAKEQKISHRLRARVKRTG